MLYKPPAEAAKSILHASCVGKAKHETFVEAQKELNAPRKNLNKRDGRIKLSAYKCQFCGFYHVGRSFKGKKPYG